MNKIYKKILILSVVFLFSFAVGTRIASADLVGGLVRWMNYERDGIPLYPVKNLSMVIHHNQVFNPGDTVDFGFSADFKKSFLKTNAYVKKKYGIEYYENCSASFSFKNESYGEVFAFGHKFLGKMTDLGNGYWRCSADHIYYEVPVGISPTAKLASVYPIFTDSTDEDHSNMGIMAEHITIPCHPTAWTPAPGTVCTGVNFTQTNSCETRPATGTKICCTCTEEFYKVGVGATSACVGAKGICNANCRKITNNCNLPIFVPAKTTPEWISLPITATNFAGCIQSVSCN